MKTKFMLFLLLSCLIGSTAMAQTKIGYANLELVLAYLPETQKMNQQLQTFQNQLAKKLESKRNYFDTKYQEYVEKSQTPGVTEAEMKPLQDELQKLQAEIQQDAQKADNDLMVRQNQMMAPVLEKLESEIKKLAQERGLYLCPQQLCQWDLNPCSRAGSR